MVVAVLEITKDRRMHWDENKDDFGTQEQRHKLGRFIIDHACHLPVTVRVQKWDGPHSYPCEPALIDDFEKLVVFYHKKYRILMDYGDAVKWIRILITSNKGYEQEQFKYYS